MRHILDQLGDVLDRRTKVRLALATSASVLLAFLDMTAILLMLPLVDLASGDADTSRNAVLRFLSLLFGQPQQQRLTVYVTLLVVGLFVAKGIGSMYLTWWLARFKSLNRVRTSASLLRHFLTAPYTQISRRSSSELIRTMMDAVTQVYGSVVFGMMQVVINSMTLAAILFALIYAAPLPTLALVSYLGLASWLYLRVVKPRAVRAGHASAAAAEASWKSAFSALGGLKETRIRGSENVFVERFRAASMRGVRPSQVAEFIGTAPRHFLEILFIIAVGVILVAGTAGPPGAMGTGSVVGLLAMFVAAGFRTLPAITAILGNLSGIRFGLPYLDLVHTEIQQLTSAGDSVASASDRRLEFAGELRIDDVTFTYPDATGRALDGVTLTVPYASSVAIVGGSGAGKTTLIDTILGLHRPESGRIVVDGVDVSTDMRAWQANIGYVPQDVYLLDATLAENIAFDESLEDIDNDRLVAAVHGAQLSDVVRGLSDGINSQIGERGARLSGGQRQRVGIARALYREPRLLVLDEATSALDNETEHRISATIAELTGKITVLIVAHRLSTVRHADSIVFLEAGRVAASGSFEHVRMVNEQFDRLARLGSLD
jgi:ABC-type multidrug transport system fused ATPase/permease subunit